MKQIFHLKISGKCVFKIINLNESSNFCIKKGDHHRDLVTTSTVKGLVGKTILQCN